MRHKVVYFDTSNNFCVVEVGGSSLRENELPIKIGGCAVYTLNFVNSFFPLGRLADTYEEISPTIIANDERSAGMGVHRWGVMSKFFTKLTNILIGRSMAMPGSICGMTWGVATIHVKCSSHFVGAGMPVAGQPGEAPNVSGCIGLRIKREQDDDYCWMERPKTDFLLRTNIQANLLAFLRKKKRLSRTNLLICLRD